MKLRLRPTSSRRLLPKLLGVIEIDGDPVWYEEVQDTRIRRETLQRGTLLYALLHFVGCNADPSMESASVAGSISRNRAWLEMKDDAGKRVRYVVEATWPHSETRQTG